MKRFSKTVVVILVILIFITALWAWKGELLPGGLPRFLPQKETAEETESLTASEESVNSTESPTEETVPGALQEENGTEQEGEGGPSVSQETGYAYGLLTEEEQQLYREMLQAITGFGRDAELSTLNPDLLETVFNSIMADHPEIFYVDGYTYTKHTLGEEIHKITFSGQYTLTQEQVREREEGIERYSRQALEGIHTGMDDYQKIKYIYDYMIEHTDYRLDGKKYMVEFVSANPTGPMHMGNARGGVLGDTLAEVLDWSGADVWREFYVNDFGNQIEKFAKSIEARYIQLIKGEDAIEFPEDGYHGDDIRELAKAFYDIHGDSYLEKSVEERHADMARFGLERNIPKMKSDLERYGIKFDEWFFESSLHNSGYVKDTVEELHKLGWTYEKEGALWLKTADIMREQYRKQGKKDEDIDKLDLKDDVLRRANGFYTYFAGDIAYHRNKFAVRHFDKVINIWGADHHGHVARMKGAMDALGLDGTNRLDIVLMQLVKLVRDGEVVRMSKRTGKTISLSDLLDEIPVDACRYFFNAKPDTQMEFDLGLAVREDSENPIYYIQYAHARICSLLKALEEEGHSVKPGAVDLSILSSDAEHALIKELSSFAEEIRMAARDYDPSYINRYLMRLAAAFHKFYNACRIEGEDEAIIDARLKLASATRQVLANGLKVIGCSAPEKM